MPREKNTDIYVAELLREAEIKATAEISGIKDIDEALKTASKRGTGKLGSPEFIAQVKDFVLIIEDKRDTNFHIK